MKKRSNSLVVFAVCIVMLFTSISCNKNINNSTDETSSESSDKTTTGYSESTGGSSMFEETTTKSNKSQKTEKTTNSLPTGSSKEDYPVAVVGKYANIISSLLKSNGYTVRILTAKDLEDSAKFSIYECSCLILSPDVSISSTASSKIKYYLGSYGDIIFLGQSGWKVGQQTIGLPLYFYYDTYQMWDLEGTVSLIPASGQTTADSSSKYKGNVEGWSALAYMYPSVSESFPILDAYDSQNRLLGRAVSVIAHFNGSYTASQWGLFGITTDSYYKSKAFSSLLLSMVNKMQKKQYFQDGFNLNQKRQKQTETYKVTEKQPSGFIRIKDGVFVKPNGEPLFLIGTNYCAPIGYMSGYGAGKSVNIDAIEEDFKKARDSGLNFFRIWSVTVDNPVVCTVVRNLSRKYGIYLLFQMPHMTEYANSSEYFKMLKEFADYWKNETMVIGYDLANEPWITTVGGMKFNGSDSPALAAKAYSTSPLLTSNDKSWCDKAVAENLWPPCSSLIPDSEKKELWGIKLLFDYAVKNKYWLGKDEYYSTFPGYTGGALTVDSKYRQAVDAINLTFKQWIDGSINAIKSVDKNHFVTVGYNSVYALLDCNESLDFNSVHIYDPPKSLANMQNNTTTLDRMQLRFPNQPAIAGEFGASCGYVVPDGRYMDPYTAAVVDMCVYMSAYAKGQAGVANWQLNETPISSMLAGMPWLASYSEADKIAQERIGLFTYDGTYRGIEKPLAKALACFSAYAHANTPGKNTSFKLISGGTRAGTSYEMKGPNGLFVGSTSYSSNLLTFSSNRAANVMVYKLGNTITVMSTTTCQVKVNVKEFGLKASSAVVSGNKGKVSVQGDYLIIDLYEGQKVSIK